MTARAETWGKESAKPSYGCYGTERSLWYSLKDSQCPQFAIEGMIPKQFVQAGVTSQPVLYVCPLTEEHSHWLAASIPRWTEKFFLGAGDICSISYYYTIIPEEQYFQQRSSRAAQRWPDGHWLCWFRDSPAACTMGELSFGTGSQIWKET